jgi:hypothetical protein
VPAQFAYRPWPVAAVPAVAIDAVTAAAADVENALLQRSLQITVAVRDYRYARAKAP